MSDADPMPRPIRSELSVPGGDLGKIEKALRLDADVVFLDLEDSVAPDRKNAARKTAVDALTELDWGRLPGAVRVNAVNTPWCYQDLIAVVERGSPRIGKIVVPKVRSPGDVAFVDRLLGQLEQQFGRAQPIDLELRIEDAAGLVAIREISAASKRITELTFGQGDFAAATGMPADDIGVADEWDAAAGSDRWLFPRQSIVFAARAAGARALNGPYAAYRSAEGFRAYCRMSRALGFDGVWCIHPDQIAIANDVFSPSQQEVERARETIAALESGSSAGRGTTSRGAMMVDEANVRLARSVLAHTENIRWREGPPDEA